MRLFGASPESDEEFVESFTAAIVLAEMAHDLRLIRRALTQQK